MRRIATLLAVFLSFPLLAQPVAALAEAYDNPTLGPSTQVNNLTVVISNMTFDLTSGSAARVMAGKDVFGLFFTGSGKYTYQSADPAEKTIAAFEVRKASSAKAEPNARGLAITDDFRELFLIAGGPVSIPELTGTGGTSLDAAFKQHREKFAKMRIGAPSHLLIRQKLDRTLSPVAWAELDGDGEAAYLLDSIEDKTEALYSFQRFREAPTAELRNAFFPIVLSEQPVGRNRRAFVDPPYLLTNLDYVLTTGEKETAKMTVTETITPRNAASGTFAFDMLSQTFDSNGKARTFRVAEVFDEAGKPLSFNHARDRLLVGLPQKIAPGTPVKIRFEIDGDFLFHPNGDSFWQLGTEPWFPQPSLNGQYYTIHSVVKVKKPWIAFAPGNTIARREEGDYAVVENQIDKPVQLAVVHAGKYAFSEETHDDLTVRVASYAGNNDRAMKQLANLAWKMIKFYEPWLGPFPFKEFNIIEIHELGYGQAPPATMFITKEAFNPIMGEDNQAYSKGINHRFAHEIAHQYWGHVVKMGSAEEQWVTESFAEYSSSLVIKKLKGQNGYDAMLARWRANAAEASSVAPIPLANRIRIPNDPRLAFIDRTYLIYDKGAYLLAALHKQLGDSKFLTFMRSLQGFFAWKYLTTPDMVKLLQRIDEGKDYTSFFDKYYYGTEMPD
jgi:hypothetical protein